MKGTIHHVFQFVDKVMKVEVSYLSKQELFVYIGRWARSSFLMTWIRVCLNR